jgi:Tfp pilus assembly protein PilF
MLSLSELKDALAALGVSTATGALRGKARRDELARRLHHARVASGDVGDPMSASGSGACEDAEQRLEHLSLSELRSALDLRQISTQTLGLKGEARRHALIQRLLNSCSIKKQRSGDNSVNVASAWLPVMRRLASSDEEDDEAKSETSSSAYSTATEFIFYDRASSADPELTLKAAPLMPQLSFTKIKAENDGSVETENLHRELFELRGRLHTTRQEQQQEVQRALKDAGIEASLSEISSKLQALERERRRLQGKYFGHELVTSELLAGEPHQTPFEFVQEDALVLLQKRHDALKARAERMKEAVAVVKCHELQAASSRLKSARQEEESLLEKIQRIETSLCAGLNHTSRSPVDNRRTSVSMHEALNSATQLSTPVLMRCRSMPTGLHHELWQQMGPDERQQLQKELRTASSFHIRRDRVALRLGAPDAGASSSQDPSPADKLGMKARFMEKAKYDSKAVADTYERALELDATHAENLGNYALFLCTICSQADQADDLFQRALAASPASAKNLANYANFLRCAREDFSGSEALYERAVAAAPRDVNIYGAYAELLCDKPRGSRDDLLLARRVLKKALSISPGHTRNQLRLAQVLARLGEKEPAERCFEQLVSALKQQRSLNDGYKHAQAGFHTPRETIASVYASYAQFLHKCGQWARAKRMYSEALTLNPQQPSLLRHL